MLKIAILSRTPKLSSTRRLREAAEKAVKSPNPNVFAIEPNTEIEIEANHQARIDQALLIPGMRRAGERTVAFNVNDGKELNNLFRLVTKVGGLVLNH